MVSKLGTVKRVLTNKSPKTIIGKGSKIFLTGAAIQSSFINDKIYEKALEDIKNRMEQEEDLEDILDTVLEIEPGTPYNIEISQLREEIRGLAKLVKESEPETVMEIGTLRGGTFYVLSRYVESAENLVSLDLPGGSIKKRRNDLLKEFAPSKNVEVIRGNSHTEETLKNVKEKVDKVDFLLIDGDHTYEGVKQDFEMYKELVAEGGIIAFHDIVPHANSRKEYKNRLKEIEDIAERHVGIGHPEWGVNRFWNEIKEDYETEEIIAHPKQQGKGIGIIHL